MRFLKRQGKATQHNRRTEQHNTTRPKQLFFKEKLAASGGTRTHDHQLSRKKTQELIHVNPPIIRLRCACMCVIWLGQLSTVYRMLCLPRAAHFSSKMCAVLWWCWIPSFCVYIQFLVYTTAHRLAFSLTAKV